MISYIPLVRTLKGKGLDIRALADLLGIQSGSLKNNLNKGVYLSLGTIDKICKVLGCEIGDVIKYEKGEQIVQTPEYYCNVNWVALEERLPVKLGEAGIKEGHSREYYTSMKRRGRMKKSVLRTLCSEYGIKEAEVLN